MRRLISNSASLFDIAILLGLAIFTNHHLPLSLVLTDTVSVGGDTPAHLYLVSQLRDSLFSSGRIVNWSQGWWCGFPMFQFYFPLPYLLAVILDLALPLNIAFKLMSVLGIYALPVATYAATRTLRVPSPAPILAAIGCQLFLFCDVHTMWGGNLYSMLAGMIGNALGFPVMILVLAKWWHDAQQGRSSSLAMIAFAALVLTHFFTAIMAGLTMLCIPLLQPAGQRRLALRSGVLNACGAGALSAWWWIPLVAKRRFSIDYGSNWDVSLLQSLPVVCWILFPLVLLALYRAVRGRTHAVVMLGWFTLVAAVLFHWGYSVSGVFVNIRLWPFVYFGLILLGASGMGMLMHGRAGNRCIVLAALIAALMHITDEQHPARRSPEPVRVWAQKNYKGLGKRPGYDAFRTLLSSLHNTPGRLAFDYSEQNDALGSPRIFELVPHLIQKPILEGGIVNSSITAHHAYYARCETSSRCTGHSALMTPASFDIPRATRHLELFNVKHFAARWRHTKEAMHRSADWAWMATAGPLELFELTSHSGQYVSIPAYTPITVRTHRPDEAGLEWLYTDALIEQPALLLPPDTALPPQAAESAQYTHDEFLRVVAAMARDGSINTWLLLGPFALSESPPPDVLAQDIPTANERLNGKTWTPLLTQSPIHPGKTYRSPNALETIASTVLHSPDERRAVLRVTHSDGLSIWLNAENIFAVDAPGDAVAERPITLSPGVNHLVLKSTQHVQEQFFHIRLTDTNGTPFTDIDVSESASRIPPPPYAPQAIAARGHGPTDESFEENGRVFRFKTDAVGLPHVIKISYFPNWRVAGADRIYRVSPTFMLVYPTQEDVVLRYGSTPSDTLGRTTSACGVLALCAGYIRRRRQRRQG